MKPIIFNAIDKLYNEKTGMVVPVSAAVGGNGPQPVPEPVEVTSSVTYTETDETIWKMELAVTWPEGMSFSALSEQYPDWWGEVTSGESVVHFNDGDLTVDYITVPDLPSSDIPANGDPCSLVIKTSDGEVTLYTSTTTAIVNELPVPVEPLEVSNVVFHYDVEEDYKTNWSCTADITMNDAPIGWSGYISVQDGEEETLFDFNTENISNGVLTISDLFFSYTTDGPDGETVNFTIIKDPNEPWDDPDNIFGSVDVAFTTEQNGL